MWGGSRTLVVFSLSVQCTTRGFKPGGMWPSSIVSWMTDSLIDGVKSTASFRSLAAFTRGAIPLGIACGLVASRLRRANLESWSKTNVFRSGESMFSAILKMFLEREKMRANISAFLLQLSPAALPCLKTAAYIMQWPQDPQSRNGTTTNWSRNLPISISRIILLVVDKFLLNTSVMLARFGNLFLEGHQDWIEQCLANLANLLGWAFLICICTFFGRIFRIWIIFILPESCAWFFCHII